MKMAPPKTNMGPENIPVRPKRKSNLVVPKPGKPGKGGISPVKPGKGNGTGGGFPKPVKPGTPVLYGSGPKKTMNTPVGSGTVGGGGKPMKPGKFPATLVGLGASLLGGKGGKKPMMAKGGMTKKGKK